MKNRVLKRGLTVAMAGAMTMIACGGEYGMVNPLEVIIDADVPLVAEAASPEEMALEKELLEQGQVFTEGVYTVFDEDSTSTEMTTFYIIYGDGTGYIEDVKADEGTYFEYEQEEYCIKFYFGFGDPYVKEFKVLAMNNGTVTGTFDDDDELEFVPVQGASHGPWPFPSLALP